MNYRYRLMTFCVFEKLKNWIMFCLKTFITGTKENPTSINVHITRMNILE
jgi:hypothetical protein